MKRRPGTTPGSRLPTEETWHPYEQLKLETVLQDVGEQLVIDPFVVFAILPRDYPGKLRFSTLGEIKAFEYQEVVPPSPACTKHEPGPWTAALARVKPELVVGELVYCKRCGEQYKYED